MAGRITIDRDRAVSFQPDDAALHSVALLVDLRLEGRGPSTACAATPAPVGGLICLDRARRSNAAPAQVRPIRCYKLVDLSSGVVASERKAHAPAHAQT